MFCPFPLSGIVIPFIGVNAGFGIKTKNFKKRA